jgi:hypothetical protein
VSEWYLARPLTIDPLQYRARDSPWYTLGHGIVLVYIGMGVLTSVVYWLTLRAENSRRDRGLRDEVIDGINDNGTSTFDHTTDCMPSTLTGLWL